MIGLEIKNGNQELLISNAFRHPHLLLKTSFGPAVYQVAIKGGLIMTQHLAVSGWDSENSGILPFLALPDDGRFYRLTYNMLSVIGTTPPSSLPNVYVFSSGVFPRGPCRGLQLLDNAGQLMYDSLLKPLHIAGAVQAGFYNTGAPQLQAGLIPSRPAYFLPNYGEDRVTYNKEYTWTTIKEWDGYWRLGEGRLPNPKMFETGGSVEDAYMLGTTYGYSNSQSLMCIDAAIYD